MKKKLLLLFLVFTMVLSLALTGCGNKETADPSTGNKNTTDDNSSDSPKEGGMLTVALAAIPKTLDPVKYTGIYESNVIHSIADTLVYYNKALNKIIPGLATKWEISDDLKTYKFTLRDDVYFQKGKFQDGRKMTAEDIKYSLERSAKESVMKRLRMLESVEVVSDTEIICHLTEPNAAFLTVLTDAGNVIVPKEEVEGWGEDFGTHLVGTGPFAFKEWKNSDSIVLEKSKNYWGEKPHLDGVTFKFITDQNMMTNALRTGEIDVATDVTGESIQAIKSDSNLVLNEKPALKIIYMSMNLMEGPTKDPKVREAIISAIDVDAMVKGLYPWGEAQRAYLALPTGSWGYDASLEKEVPKYDPERAKQLMKEAGYPDGFKTEIYVSGSDKAAVIIQDYLKKNLNIDVKINLLEWGTFSEVVSKGKAPMYAMSWTWYPDPDFFLYQMFHSKQIGSLGNGQGFSDSKVDELLDKAVSETADQNERAKLYKEALKIITENNGRINFANGKIIDGINKKVHDFERGSDGTIFITNPEINVWKE
jgi:peptide/nickel transport system substrate-binding protein